MMMTCLINEMLKCCRCVIKRSIVVEIGVKGEIRKGLPWWLNGVENVKVDADLKSFHVIPDKTLLRDREG